MSKQPTLVELQQRRLQLLQDILQTTQEHLVILHDKEQLYDDLIAKLDDDPRKKTQNTILPRR